MRLRLSIYSSLATLLLVVALLLSLLSSWVRVEASRGVVSIDVGISTPQVGLSASKATVVYTPELDTDLKKLAAIYALREQFRLEHNRQGAIARSSWPASQGKWASYTELYKQAIAPVNSEYIRLRESIRRSSYTDAQWAGLSRSPVQLELLFGDRERLKSVATASSVASLSALKSLDLDNLEGAFIDPYEDWTTYTETDPNSVLTVAANQITFTGMTRASASTVYSDKGVDHFGATFQHLVDTRLTGQTGGDFEAQSHVWGVANITNPTNATDPIIAVFWAARPSTGNAHIYLMVDDGATDQNDATGQIALNTIFYLTIDKNATDTDARLYSDSARTNLLDTLTVANGSTSYRYMHSAFPRGGSGTGTVSGDIYNLDLQEAGGTPAITVSPTSYDFGVVTASSTPSTSTTYFTIDNTSDIQTDQTIAVTTSTWSGGVTWTHSDTATAGANTAGLKANKGGTWDTGDVIVKYDTPNFIAENQAASTDYSFGLKLIAPTSFTDGVQKQIIVRVTAAAG